MATLGFPASEAKGVPGSQAGLSSEVRVKSPNQPPVKDGPWGNIPISRCTEAIPSVSCFLKKVLGKCALSPGSFLNCAINVQIDSPHKSHFIVILLLLTFYWITFIVIQLHSVSTGVGFVLTFSLLFLFSSIILISPQFSHKP